MIRQASVYTFSNFPNLDILSRIQENPCPELSALSVDVMGWEPWDEQSWLIEHHDLIAVQIARRFRRVPKALLDEHMRIAMLEFDSPMTAQEKRQLKQRTLEKLLPLVIPEKVVTTLLIDKRHNTLTVASQNASLVEKILRVFQDSFPGVMVAKRWSKEAVRRAIGKAWQKDAWPVGMKPESDVMLVHSSGQYQKIRFSGLSDDLTVVDDSLLHNYVIIGLRLTHSEGLSCFITPLGNFQGMKYPANEEPIVLEHSFDWLPVLELRAWIELFGSWVHES